MRCHGPLSTNPPSYWTWFRRLFSDFLNLTSASVAPAPQVVSQAVVTMGSNTPGWTGHWTHLVCVKGWTMRPRRWWTVPANVAGTVAWRLPGALMGAILGVAAGSMLGPPGLLLALMWLVTGMLTGCRFGERALARTVLRYRPAPDSWLEAEVRRLLRDRPVDVYVARKASGVFALGGHTIGLGELSVGTGGPTPALLAATAAAAQELRFGRTRPELPLLWWSVPWWFAKQLPGRLLPRRWLPLIKLWAVGVVTAAIVNGVQTGHLFVIVMTGLAVNDLCITGVRGRRQRRKRPTHRQLQPANAANAAVTRPMPSGNRAA